MIKMYNLISKSEEICLMKPDRSQFDRIDRTDRIDQTHIIERIDRADSIHSKIIPFPYVQRAPFYRELKAACRSFI